MLDHFRTHDKQLFAQLEVIAGGLVEAATLLHLLLSGSDADAAATAAAARTLDVSGGGAGTVDVREFTAYAMRLDNVGFRNLALSLDAAFESVQAATAHAHSLRASNAAPPLRALAALLVDAATMVRLRVPDAGRRSASSTAAGDASNLLERGDALYYEGVGVLFAGSSDPTDTLRWKDVYDAVHKALARCVEAADGLSRLVR